MKFGSLFAGIGGIDLGLERAGMECRWQVEIDPFCQRVLAKHWPNVARYSDVREVGKHNLEPVDLICGGFPCQDVSLAGERLGYDGERSSLWSQMARIIHAMSPRWVLAENVPGLLSANDGWFFGKVLSDLANIGYDAEWEVLPARAFGAPHERERIFIIAYPHKKHRKTRLGDIADRAPKIFRESPAECAPIWLQAPPVIDRMDDGLPSWFYEYAAGAYGNAVVPQVIEWIGHRIMEASQCA